MKTLEVLRGKRREGQREAERGHLLMHCNRKRSCLWFFVSFGFLSPDPIFHFKLALTLWLHFKDQTWLIIQRKFKSGEKEAPSATVPSACARLEAGGPWEDIGLLPHHHHAASQLQDGHGTQGSSPQPLASL